LNLAEIQQESELGRNLIDHTIVYQNYFNLNNLNLIKEEIEFKNIQKESSEVFEYGNFDFAMQIWFDTKFNFRIKYNQLRFSSLSIKTIKKHWINLLTEIVNKFQLPISKYEILTQEEKTYLLETLNDTKADYPSDKTIVDLFEDQVEKTPGAIAIKFRATELTYRELNEKSNQLAHYLIENYNIQPDELVGIEIDRSEWMIIGILAILKSGGAYVPIDINYPEQRKKNIYNQISSKLLLNQDLLDEFLMVRSLYSSVNQRININSNSLVYCMFTSGSTGNPKGVLIEHKMLVNSTLSRTSVYKNTQKKGILLYSFSFDSSVNLTFRLLTTGGCLVIYKDSQLDLSDLSDSIRKYQIDTLTIPPSIYDSLLTYEGISSLKCVIVAGEECKPKVLKKHFECLPETKLYNEYGPTECVVWCTYKLFEQSTDKVTIGKPVPSYKIYLLEVNGDKLVPLGCMGEICVGGISVGRGYLDDENLTKEKFIDNPYKPWERLYRTGDLGRWNSQFELEYLGRIDNQVKIRGFRVELNEIENAILEYENNQKVIVVFSKNQFEDGRLIAYIKSQNKNLHLLDELRKKLPDYMVPDVIVWMKEMPLTPNLKIDYKNLPNPEENFDKQIILPRNKVEEEIYEIWKVVLGNNSENISVTDYFFQLGGNSIRAIKLLALIYKKFGQKIEISFLFEKGTIESLAQYINNKYQFLINSDYQEIKI